MSNIMDELLESFRESSQRLEGLSKGLGELQNAQNLVEKLSSNLNEAAQGLEGTAISHANFIKSAQLTNDQLGQVVRSLNNLDTTSINSTLSEIVTGLDGNKEKLTNLATSLTKARTNSNAMDAKINQISQRLDEVVLSNTSLSSQLADSLKNITSRADEASTVASKRHKNLISIVLIAFAISGVVLANLLDLLPF